MSNSLAEKLDGIPRKALAMKGEAAHKKVVESKDRAFLAQILNLAFDRSGIDRKEAAYLMGYGDDQSAISRWTSGIEAPQMARFMSVPQLRMGLAIAIAETDQCAEVRTVLTFKNARTA